MDEFIDSSVLGGALGGAAIMPSQIQVNPPPDVEVVPAAAGWLPLLNFALPRTIDDLTARLTSRVYEAMLTDPAVASSFNSHKMSILAGGMKLVSPVKQPAWAKAQQSAPPQPGKAPAGKTPTQPDRSLTPDQKLAAEVLDFCQRAWDRLRVSRENMLFELLDAMAYGAKMAEIIYETVEEGPDAGKLTWKAIKVKPNWGWRFIVDNKFNVVGFLTFNPLGGYLVYPAEKFIWLSWMPIDCDPRGNSILRAAYNAWNLKIQAWPQHYRHLVRFGSPGLDFEMAENDTSDKPSITATGQPKGDGSTMGAGVYYATLLGVYQNGGILVHPAGSKLTIAEPQSNGEAFQLAIELYNREIMLAVEYQTRSALESQHGSKADSETAQDRKDLITGYGRDWLSAGAYKAFRHLVFVNFGADAAERFTPYPTFGNTEGANKAETWTAAASVGYQIGPSQLEEMDDELGLPIRDRMADQAEADMAMEKMAALNPPPNSGDTTGAKGQRDGAKPKPQPKPKPKAKP